MSPIWGVDLGGTKIECAVLGSINSNDVLCRERIATEQEKGYEHIIGQIGKLIDQISEKVGFRPERLGIGTPGTLDPVLNTMKNCNTTCLNGRAFKDDLSAYLGIPIEIANDANCFALAEALMGVVPAEMPEAKVVFGVILGTGVGGGIVINGKVLQGRQGIAGEWGHNFLDDSGYEAYTGRHGVVETILSGTALQRYYVSKSGEQRTLKEIYQRYQQGVDPIATETIERLTHFFGLAISVVINILDPDAIVVGGGVGNIDELYTIGKTEIEKFLFNNRLDTKLFKPKLGDSAGVFGAALLVS